MFSSLSFVLFISIIGGLLIIYVGIYIPIDTLCFILERPRELIGAQVVYVVVL